jgi:hypothetical protein
MEYKYCVKFKVGQGLYEMIASNFLFNFIPKELLYVKNNSSKHKLKLSAARRATFVLQQHVTETAGVLCTAYSSEDLMTLSIVLVVYLMTLSVISHYVAFND